MCCASVSLRFVAHASNHRYLAEFLLSPCIKALTMLRLELTNNCAGWAWRGSWAVDDTLRWGQNIAKPGGTGGTPAPSSRPRERDSTT